MRCSLSRRVAVAFVTVVAAVCALAPGAWATAPGANGRIAFQTDRSGTERVAIVNADGAGFRYLTDEKVAETAPAWSPDGLKVAFVGTRDDATKLYLVDYLTGTVSEILAKEGVTIASPAFSPDGAKIAFAGTVAPATKSDIWVFDLAAPPETALTNLTDTADSDEAWPVWSPAGDEVLFAGNGDGNWEIYGLELSGGAQPKNLTNDATRDDFQPDFAPSGISIVFASRAIETGVPEPPASIYTLELADGATPELVSPEGVDCVFPSFSPAEDKVLFAGLVDGNRDLWVVDFPGGANLTRLTTDAGVDTKPAWQAIQPGETAPPEANAGDDTSVECTSYDGGIAELDGSASTSDEAAGPNPIAIYEWFENFGAPDEAFLGLGSTLEVTLALGVHDITLQVTDSLGQTAIDSVRIEIVDTTPPEISVRLSPNSLWPPNHKMIPVHAQVIARDVCSPTVEVVLASVTSSEPDNGKGDGNTSGDIQGARIGEPDFNFLLRAERSGGGSGRVYTATYTATDESGNSADASAKAVVAHDQSGKSRDDAATKSKPSRSKSSSRR